MEENVQPNPYLIPGAIVLAGALIAAAVIYTNLPKTNPSAKGTGAANKSLEQNAGSNLADDGPFLGSPEAPVAMVEFSDFQCPFCRRFFKETLPQIKEKYVKTGKVKFVYRDFPLVQIHNMAQKYAEAGECANEEGKFWQMHDKIFEEQEKLGQGTVTGITAADVKKWAREIGLDGQRFDQCLDSGKYAQEVGKDYNDGVAAGVSGTPGTFVNGRLVQGAVPYTQFEQIIEEELKKTQ